MVPIFDAIDLEDIKAPDCFTGKRIRRERLGVPVFHDDQHAIAITIVVGAAVNAFHHMGRDIATARPAAFGAGAAGMSMLQFLGMPAKNVTVFDEDGVLRPSRADLAPEQMAFANGRAGAPAGADVFLGLSEPGLPMPDMGASIAERSVISALADPMTEIMPDRTREAAPGAVMVTCRSEFPNQVTGVFCLPFLFRGALDVGAARIDKAMRVACVDAIARAPVRGAACGHGRRLSRRAADLRPGLPDHEALRSAPAARVSRSGRARGHGGRGRGPVE